MQHHTSLPKELFHVSLEKLDNLTFTPKVPGSVSTKTNENNTIPRICLSSSLEGCLTAIPEPSNYMYDQETKRIPFFAYIYSISTKTIPSQNIVTPETLVSKNYVFDADLSQEYWVINQTIQFTKPKLIRIKSMDEESIYHTKYNLSSSKISNAKYEHAIENFDRIYTYNFSNPEDFFSMKSEIKKHKCIIKKEGTFNNNYFFYIRFLAPRKTDMTTIWEKYLDIRLRYLDDYDSCDFYEGGL